MRQEQSIAHISLLDGLVLYPSRRTLRNSVLATQHTAATMEGREINGREKEQGEERKRRARDL